MDNELKRISFSIINVDIMSQRQLIIHFQLQQLIKSCLSHTSNCSYDLRSCCRRRQMTQVSIKFKQKVYGVLQIMFQVQLVSQQIKASNCRQYICTSMKSFLRSLFRDMPYSSLEGSDLNLRHISLMQLLSPSFFTSTYMHTIKYVL